MIVYILLVQTILILLTMLVIGVVLQEELRQIRKTLKKDK